MSFKDNYLKLLKKSSKGPYSFEKEEISRGAIDSIMRGSTPSVDTAYKIAKALNVTVEELVTGKKQGKCNEPEKGNESRINKSREDKKMETKKLFGVEDLSQDKLNKLQDIIDDWLDEALQARRAKRAGKSKSKKNNNTA